MPISAILSFLGSKPGIILVALLALGAVVGVEHMRIKLAQAGEVRAQAAEQSARSAAQQIQTANDSLVSKIKLQNDRIDELANQEKLALAKYEAALKASEKVQEATRIEITKLQGWKPKTHETDCDAAARLLNSYIGR